MVYRDCILLLAHYHTTIHLAAPHLQQYIRAVPREHRKQQLFSIFNEPLLSFSSRGLCDPVRSLIFSLSLSCWIVPAVLFLLSGECVPERLTRAPLTLSLSLTHAVIWPSVPNWLSALRLSVGTEKKQLPGCKKWKRGTDVPRIRDFIAVNVLLGFQGLPMC